MFLPHEICALTFALSPSMWQDLFGTDDQRAAHWQQLREPWWPEHPARARIMADPSKAVPLRLHGDDGAFKKGLIRLTMLVFT